MKLNTTPEQALLLKELYTAVALNAESREAVLDHLHQIHAAEAAEAERKPRMLRDIVGELIAQHALPPSAKHLVAELAHAAVEGRSDAD